MEILRNCRGQFKKNSMPIAGFVKGHKINSKKCVKKCLKCQKEILVHFNSKYCQDCVKIAKKEATFRHYHKYPEKSKEASKKWLKAHPNYSKEKYKKYLKEKLNYRERINNYARNHFKKNRLKVLNHYGAKCACCGETQMEFLAVDHKNNDGNKHRKEIGYVNIYAWIIRNKYPTTFQILCHNCNLARSFYGECPHNRKKQNT